MGPPKVLQFVPIEIPDLPARSVSVPGETSWLDAAPPDRVGADESTGGASVVSDRPYFEFNVDREARLLPGAAPRYPEMLRGAGVAGEVLAQFVVDENGRYEAGTFKALKSSHELFTAAVRNVLPNMKFYPAEVGGRKVKQLVQQPFTFSITK